MTTTPIQPAVPRRDDGTGAFAWLREVRTSCWVFACVLVTIAIRLPFISMHLGPDEGGFLLLGSQWAAEEGSLYGAYWVDRPPLIIAISGLADYLGGAAALRLIGCLFAGASVLFAAIVGSQVRGSQGARWSALAAAAFVTTPWFGAPEVSGELLAVPFVLGSISLTLGAVATAVARRQWVLGSAAGALAAIAPLIKQNFIDGFVFALVAVAGAALFRQLSRSSAARLFVAGIVGASSTVVLVLGWATTRGTQVGELWYALVSFRAEAALLISQTHSPANDSRLLSLIESFISSGALALAVAFVWVAAFRRNRNYVVLALFALGAWAAFSVVAGGSFWRHYLTQAIPALSLAAAIVCADLSRLRRIGKAIVVYAAVLVIAVAITDGSARLNAGSRQQDIGRWLDAAAEPGDTVVIAWGQPNIIYEAGLTSPYSLLWSLPVRVRDPELRELSAVLGASDAPIWLLVSNDNLGAWQIDASRAESIVEERYERFGQLCDLTVYLRSDAERDFPPVPSGCDSDS